MQNEECPACGDVHREHPMPPADAAFMGRMLGFHTCADCDSFGCADVYVRRHMADPIANARAQRHIGELLMQCEQIKYYLAVDQWTTSCINCAHMARYHEDKGLLPGGKCDPWYTGDGCDCPGFAAHLEREHNQREPCLLPQ